MLLLQHLLQCGKKKGWEETSPHQEEQEASDGYPATTVTDDPEPAAASQCDIMTEMDQSEPSSASLVTTDVLRDSLAPTVMMNSPTPATPSPSP